MNNNKEIRVTTMDNPYDPFTHWEEWYLFDINAGYNTCARLASVTFIGYALSEAETYRIIEQGIDRLIKTGSINKEGNIVEYKKVIKNNIKKD
jgi:hypothetical protein